MSNVIDGIHKVLLNVKGNVWPRDMSDYDDLIENVKRKVVKTFYWIG